MRLTWAAATLVLLSAPAFASTDTQLASCAAISDKLDRLICYDKLAGSISQTSSTTAAPVSKLTSPATIDIVTDDFGLEQTVYTKEDFGLVKKTDVEKIDKLYFTVSDIQTDAYGALIITMENQQIWKQSGTQRFKLANKSKVFIERGAFGSFLLGTDGRNSTIRVKRLK